MKLIQKKWLTVLCFIGAGIVFVVALLLIYRSHAAYGFSREVPEAEQLRRMEVVAAAEEWLGVREGFAGHEKLVQIYNAHEPLAQGYEMTVDDNWCAAFGSVIAIQTDNTDIIPTECGCQRQIGLWQEMGRWQTSVKQRSMTSRFSSFTQMEWKISLSSSKVMLAKSALKPWNAPTRRAV